VLCVVRESILYADVEMLGADGDGVVHERLVCVDYTEVGLGARQGPLSGPVRILSTVSVR
jgi:hypothetical protein